LKIRFFAFIFYVVEIDINNNNTLNLLFVNEIFQSRIEKGIFHAQIGGVFSRI